MEQDLQATTPKGLWLLVVLGPIITAIEMQANFVLVRHACSAQRNLVLYAVIILAIALTAATAFVAFAIWMQAGRTWPTEAPDVATRVRFIAVLGILSSAMSFLLIVAQGIATIQFDPCQR
jgi:vacuolar-type H+-ATPase subunit I/STV1